MRNCMDLDLLEVSVFQKPENVMTSYSLFELLPFLTIQLVCNATPKNKRQQKSIRTQNYTDSKMPTKVLRDSTHFVCFICSLKLAVFLQRLVSSWELPSTAHKLAGKN